MYKCVHGRCTEPYSRVRSGGGAGPAAGPASYAAAMELSEQTEYDATLAEVIAVETDWEEYLTRFAEGGDRDVELIECGPDGDGFVVHNKRVVTVDLPGFARKALKPSNTVDHLVRIGPEVAGRREATYTLDVLGAPVRTDGTIVFEEVEPGRTRHTVTCDVTVKVPLIGGKIAAWAKDDIVAQVRREFEYTRRRVAERRQG